MTKVRERQYRVRWTLVEKHEGFITDGDQDGDAWEGSRKSADSLAKELAKIERRERAGFTYKVVPVNPVKPAKKASP
jgi:hypothetical protein